MFALFNRNLSFIKIINAGEQYLVNNIDGMLTLALQLYVYSMWTSVVKYW